MHRQGEWLKLSTSDFDFNVKMSALALVVLRDVYIMLVIIRISLNNVHFDGSYISFLMTIEYINHRSKSGGPRL